MNTNYFWGHSRGGDTTTFKVAIDVSKSASRDVSKRGILEILLSFLEGGTPVKNDGSRTIEGLGKGSVRSIVGVVG